MVLTEPASWFPVITCLFVGSMPWLWAMYHFGLRGALHQGQTFLYLGALPILYCVSWRWRYGYCAVYVALSGCTVFFWYAKWHRQTVTRACVRWGFSEFRC